MDIIVTIPKKRLAQVEVEEADMKRRLASGEQPIKAGQREGLAYFWALGVKPARLVPGDRVYFVWEGAVRGWHEVIHLGEDLTCDLTGIPYAGCCIVLAPEIHDLYPIVYMKGFRGFKYTGRLGAA